jgi:hypothetical protein
MYLFVALVVTALMGVAALIGTGDLHFNFLADVEGEQYTSWKRFLSNAQDGLGIAVSLLLALGLTPLLRPRALLRSGVKQRGSIQRTVFSMASAALLLGVPLFLFGLMARENVSGYNELRDEPGSFLSGHVKPSFLQRIRYEGEPLTPDEAVESSEGLASARAPSADGSPRSSVHDVLDSSAAEGHRAPETTTASGDGKRSRRDSAVSARFSLFRRYWCRIAFGDLETSENAEEPYRQQAGASQIDKAKAATGTPKDAQFNSQLSTDIWKQGKDLGNRLLAVNGSRNEYDNQYRSQGFTTLPGRWWNSRTIRDLMNDRDDYGRELAKIINDFLDSPSFHSTYFSSYATVQEDDNSSGQAEQKEKRHQAYQRAAMAARACESMSEEQRQDERYQEGLRRELRLANWGLLQLAYGEDAVPSPSDVYASVVNRTLFAGDQPRRLLLSCIFAGIFVVSILLVNLNSTSLHSFYCESLAEAWLAPKRANRGPLRLEDLGSARLGLPYHLVNGTLHYLEDKYYKRILGLVDPDTETPLVAPFLFSKEHCGPDEKYDSECRREDITEAGRTEPLPLDETIAISGAAVSPAYFQNWFVVFLMVLFNFRLGKWVRRPMERDEPKGWLGRFGQWVVGRPTPAVLAWDYLFRAPAERRYVLVTDGGHYENLGIEPLLKRKCRVIIASDVEDDRQYRFESLLALIRRARVYGGIDFDWTPELGRTGGQGRNPGMHALDKLRPTRLQAKSDKPRAKRLGIKRLRGEKRGFSKRHFVVAEIRYGPKTPASHKGKPSYLVYVKSSLTGDEPPDLLCYRDQHKSFPHESTLDQFFEEQQFESYRQLGEHIGDRLCQDLPLFDHEQMSKDHPYLAETSTIPETPDDSRRRRQPETTAASP